MVGSLYGTFTGIFHLTFKITTFSGYYYPPTPFFSHEETNSKCSPEGFTSMERTELWGRKIPFFNCWSSAFLHHNVRDGKVIPSLN